MNEEAFKTLTNQFGSLASSVGQLIVAVHGAGQAIHGLEQMATAPAKAFDGLRSAIASYQQTVSRINASYSAAVQQLSKQTLNAAQSLAKQKELEEATAKALKNVKFEAFGNVMGVTIALFGQLIAGLGNVIGGLIQLGIAALPGGLETFNDVISYVATVVGSAFAPAIVLVMAGLVTLADMLSGPVLAGVTAFLDGGVDKWLAVIEDWIAQFITWTNGFIGGAEALLQGIWWFVSAVREVGKFLIAYGPMLIGAWFGSVFGPLGAAIGAFVGLVLSIIAKLGGGVNRPDRSKGEVTPEQHRKNLETRARAEGLPPGWVDEQLEREKKEKAKNIGPQFPRLPGAPKLDQLFDKTKINDSLKSNLAAVVSTMQTHQGEKANLGFTGIAEVQKQIQMQAFQSEIEARKLRVQEQILRELTEHFGKRHDNSPTPPTRK